MKKSKTLWVALFLLATFSPLGLVLPEYFGAGGAWGEESPSEVQKIVGFLPAKMTELADLWQAPLPDYAFPGTPESAPIHQRSWSYFISAVLGLLLCGGVGALVARALSPRGHSEKLPQPSPFNFN